MYVNLECSCEAMLQIDSDWVDSTWMMIYRFADAHVTCGFMTPREDVVVPTKPVAADPDAAPED